MPDLPTGPSQEADYVTNRAKEDARRAEDKRIEVSILARLEPDCNGVNAVSSAISLKRIADSLERLEIREACKGGVPHAMPGACPAIPADVLARHYNKRG